MSRTPLRLLLSALLAAAGACCVALPTAAPAHAAPATYAGTLRLTGGSCSGGTVSGTYLRMILPSGGPSGPYLSNSDSPCSDQSYTPLQPGTDGGLIAGSYQPTPSPAFDANGNALAKRITQPAQFYGTGFALATNPTDPQTGLKVPAPTVTISGTKITADLAAWAVTWNDQNFNQGSPKPDGTYPSNTRAATGTYDPSTGAFTLDWTSTVVGGPFDKFTGAWHLVGHLTASSSGSTTGTSGGGAAPQQGAAPGQPQVIAGRTVTPSGAAASRSTVAPSATATTAPAAQDVAAAPVASTQTVITHGWRAHWWLIALVVVIAVAAIGGFWFTGRKGES